ncbi:ketoacyl-ACP synthase III family protein [Streptomyces roseoverticillatus]|uniref:Ketoacyl-ACP synthase III family protein n=1 Tax=Streptomyces roseoverticillatus TaxID=66429 RepID=A0ABV3J292_9ACTN
MRYDRTIYLAGTGAWLPEPSPLGPEAEAGRVSEHHRSLGYESIAVAGDVAGAEMAVRAARTAVRRSGLGAAGIDLVLHASLGFQGVEWWPAASWIASQSAGPGAVAFDVQQRSNGGLGALHLAAAQLASGAAGTALITTGDNFAPPYVDRWAMQFHTIYGDAGTAVVLSTRAGFARLKSTVTFADTSLEPFSRGGTPFALVPGTGPVPLLQRFIAQSRTPEAAGAWDRLETVMLRARDTALADAGLRTGDIARVVVPNVHRGNGRPENYDALGFGERQSVWEFGRRVGHLGAGDQFAGLNHLVEEKGAGVGDHVLLFGVGVGYTVSAAVLEITGTPPL